MTLRKDTSFGMKWPGGQREGTLSTFRGGARAPRGPSELAEAWAVGVLTAGGHGLELVGAEVNRISG